MHQGLEVRQLRLMAQHRRGLVELVVDVVFHGLHVVVGDGLMGGVPGDALGTEILGDGTQESLLLLGQRLHAGNDGLVAVAFEAIGEQNHPFHFDAHALAVQRGLAQIFDKGSRLLVVAAVKRGQCDCWRDVSKLHSQ